MPAIVPLDRLTAMPWRNGLGRTIEIVQGPGWRVSLANIDGDAPFSTFPGLTRYLALAGGRDLSLDIAGVRRHLTTPGDIACFDGGADVQATCHGGPVRAFNLMVAAGRTGHIEICNAPRTIDRAASMVVLPLSGAWHVDRLAAAVGQVAIGSVPCALAPEPGETSCALVAVVQDDISGRHEETARSMA